MKEEKIGDFLLELRKEKNMTQEDLANYLHVDRGTISKWERGIYLPKPDLLLKLSNLFSISVNEILLGERKNEENEQKINYVTIDVLKESRKKVKRVCFFSILILFLIILIFSVLFFGTYFVKNYNTISVYSVTGENEKFELYDTLIFVSKDYTSLLVGGVKNHSQEKIYSISVYYQKDGKKEEITRLTGLTHYFKNEIYEDLEFLKQNLYIDILYGQNRKETKIETIKLTVNKEFSNDYFSSPIKST